MSSLSIALIWGVERDWYGGEMTSVPFTFQIQFFEFNSIVTIAFYLYDYGNVDDITFSFSSATSEIGVSQYNTHLHHHMHHMCAIFMYLM